MAKTVAFVPVREGSKSIPLKNIKPFYGQPLVFWVLKALQKVEAVDEVIVATDGPEIARTVLAFGLTKVRVYDRKQENANDTASTESVMLEYLESTRLEDKAVFLLVQATSPLTQSTDFEKGLKLMSQPDIDSVISCCRNKRFFWSAEGEPFNYNYKDRPRRQDFDGLLMENGAFYINTVGNIKDHQNRLSGKIGICEMPEYTGLELDEPNDWEIGEQMMNKLLGHVAKRPIKLVLTDVDGVLTDSGMYYGEDGAELKKFNTRDGMGFELLRKAGLKTGIITSEKTALVERRGRKLKVDHLHQGIKESKLECAMRICEIENIDLTEVAYLGDDVNDLTLLNTVGLPACPADAVSSVKQVPGIRVLPKAGGQGVFRDLCELILNMNP